MAGTTEVHVVLRPGHTTVSTATKEVLKKFDVDLQPQFPGTDDPSLVLFWLAHTPRKNPAALVAALVKRPEVDGAYVKPPEPVP